MRTFTLTLSGRVVAAVVAATLLFAALLATVAYAVADSRATAAAARAAGAETPVLAQGAATATNPLGITSTRYSTATATAVDGKPKVVVVGTGGTISGKATGRETFTSYRSGSYLMEDMLDALRPELDDVADVSAVQFGNAGSSGYSIAQFHALTLEVEKQLETADAVVVTTGTDTQEEFAYWLDLTVQSRKPVVTSGSMRPWGAGDGPDTDLVFGTDAPANLYNAIKIAASQQTYCFGTVLMLNDEIQAAREVTKTNSYRIDTFQTREYGVLGWIDGENITLGRAPARVLACDGEEWFTPFDLSDVAPADLPRTEIVTSYQQAGGESITAFADAGVKGIVTAGTGAGGISSAMSQARSAAIRDKGMWFVSTTRTGSGSSYGSGNGIIAGGDLTAIKARLLLLLTRAFTDDLDTAKTWFASFGSPSFDQSATAAAVGAEPGATAVLFSGTATPACKADKAELTVSITNKDTVSVDVRVDSPAGGYKFSKIPAGKTVKHTIPTSSADLAAGDAKLTAYKNVDGKGVQTISTAAYPATTC
ncbi:asparaginase [Cellulosimicrobium arenosum]|uniref:asparaginase n=1 Tax=Cellulosimicrobium arenosum TaxID=2708133 RepID=UPI001F507050|nr:asparaginase [Cellulosimicrobium arenosum]